MRNTWELLNYNVCQWSLFPSFLSDMYSSTIHLPTPISLPFLLPSLRLKHKNFFLLQLSLLPTTHLLYRQTFAISLENKVYVYVCAIAAGKGLVSSFSEPSVAVCERCQAGDIIPTVNMVYLHSLVTCTWVKWVVFLLQVCTMAYVGKQTVLLKFMKEKQFQHSRLFIL